MKYILNDENNCNRKAPTYDQSFFEPCSPTNASYVCKNDLDCLSMEVEYNSYYRLRPCTVSKMSSHTLGCFCQRPSTIVNGISCKKSKECYPGLRCGKPSWLFDPICVSCQANSSVIEFTDNGKSFCADSALASETDGLFPGAPPCIAVDALLHFKQDELVFSEHIRTTVLCDVHRNCATAGHMVMHKSTPMMMKTYCAQRGIECRYRTKFVNSPRMKMGIRIPSFSNNFIYTAFAARHESLIEEYVLSAIIRANL